MVPTFGVTCTGADEPAKDLANTLNSLQRETGFDMFMRVDRTSSAMVAPFCALKVEFDFELPTKSAISTSGSECGLAPVGVGWVVWRYAAELPEELDFHASYLGGDMPIYGINFSCSAGQIVARYYDFFRLGRVDHRRVHHASCEAARCLPAEIASLGSLAVLCAQIPTRRLPPCRGEYQKVSSSDILLWV